MQKSANIYARVEPDIKARAETVLGELGIPLSFAIEMFLRQVVLHNGIPFDMKLPERPPLCLGALSPEELDTQLQEDPDDIEAGRVYSAAEVRAAFQ